MYPSRKVRFPPGRIKLDPDLDRRSILERTNGTPLGVIAVDVNPSEVYEAETWQRNGGNDGGIWLRTFSPVDRNVHVFVWDVLGNGSHRASESSSVLSTL